MAFLSLTRDDDVIQVDTPDGDGHILLRNSISKQDFNRILGLIPKDTDDVGAGAAFASKVTEFMVKGWSLEDEEGNPIKFTAANFNKLDASAANWISREANKQFQKITGSEVEDMGNELSA